MQGRVTHWNEHAERLYGWSCEEAMGRHIAELTVEPDKAGVAEEIMQTLREGETWEASSSSCAKTARRRRRSRTP